MSLLNIPTFAGLTVNGVYKGTRLKQGKPNQQGQSIDQLIAGMAIKTIDPYGSEVEQTFEVIISQNLISQGIPAKLHQFQGTEISLPVWGRVWVGAKSNGCNYYLANTVTDLFK